MSNAKPETLPQVESMDRAAWKQTLKDLPVAALAYALAYGVTRTALQQVGSRIAQGAPPPAWVAHTPAIMAGLSTVAGLATSRQRGVLKERRDSARGEK